MAGLDPKAHAQRIETSTSSGVPDINICIGGKEIWVETKVADPYVLLRPFQWSWINRRGKAGGVILVLAANFNGRWFHAWRAEDLKVEPYSRYLRVVSQPRNYLMTSDNIAHMLHHMVDCYVPPR